MLQADLAAAKIEPIDADGNIADFHALRHTAITRFLQSGRSLAEAMIYARHSDPKLTVKRYGHLESSGFAVAMRDLDVPCSAPRDKETSSKKEQADALTY